MRNNPNCLAVRIFLAIFAAAKQKNHENMGKFINPFTDVGFKRIFGQEFSKPVLIAFLNGLLKDERCIVDVKFLDKEQVRITDGDRSLIYDIYCKTETGEHIIVEMQNKYQPYFKQRSIYYLSRSVVEQGERGSEWNYDIKAVYLVAFLNFKISDISSEFRTDVALMDMKRLTMFSDKVRLTYLQLPFFTKEADECENIFERIIFVLKNMDILQRMPWVAQDAVFKRLSEIAEVASLDKEERRQYDESLRHYRDTLVVMEGQYLEGEAKGRAEGEKKKALDIARNLKAMGLSIDDIARASGLTTDEVAAL